MHDGSATSTALWVQDAGNVTFLLAILVFFQAVQFVGLIANAIFRKRYD